MAQNKKHHYVPRFYLKRFSPNGKSISLYNIPSGQKVLGANLYNQCARDYFYGKDLTVEKALASAESELAQLLRAMDEIVAPPPRDTPAYQAMLFFVLSQHGRTLYAADALNEMLDKMIKSIYGEHMLEEEGIDLNKFNISFTEPGQWALGHTILGYPLLLDLDYKVLVNKTSEEFVVSDNPVVFYNQLMSFRESVSNCGLASKGLQIFVPLDPRKVLMMYDAGVYRTGSDSKIVIDVTNPKDVYELNTLQFVSARDNCYFHDAKFGIEPLRKKAQPFMRDRKTTVRKFESKEHPEGKKSQFIATAAEDVRTNFNVSFITLRKSAKKWREEFRRLRKQPAVVVRDQGLVDLQREFRSACERGEYTAMQFYEFLKDNEDAGKGEAESTSVVGPSGPGDLIEA